VADGEFGDGAAKARDEHAVTWVVERKIGIRQISGHARSRASALPSWSGSAARIDSTSGSANCARQARSEPADPAEPDRGRDPGETERCGSGQQKVRGLQADAGQQLVRAQAELALAGGLQRADADADGLGHAG